MATIVYIDGFNFYYGAVKGTKNKWVDYAALCQRLLPKDTIVKIRLFTATVKSAPGDPSQASRQHAFLRALSTYPIIEIHYGHFSTRVTTMPLASPLSPTVTTARVRKTEEKGSDVNLATYLLLDAFQSKCDTAVVISNDSDLAEPIRVAREELGVEVGVVNPHLRSSRSKRLKGTFFKRLRPGLIEQCQLPSELTDASGTIHKPEAW